MRIVGCGLIAVAALLGLAPTAMASELPDGPSSASAETLSSTGSVSTGGHGAAQRQPEPQDEVSLLAVTLTAGAAVAAAGSGVAQAVTRRRAVSRATRQPTRDPVRW